MAQPNKRNKKINQALRTLNDAGVVPDSVGDGQIVLRKETQQISSYSGPVPQADDLGKYNAIIANGAERLVVMAEENHRHRIEMDRRDADHRADVLAFVRSQSKTDNTFSSRGQIISAALIVVVLILAFYMVAKGNGNAAAIMIGTVIVGLASVYVTGRAIKPAPPPDTKEEN